MASRSGWADQTKSNQPNSTRQTGVTQSSRVEPQAQPGPGEPPSSLQLAPEAVRAETEYPTSSCRGPTIQAATTKAAKAELTGDYDTAFKLNIDAAQTYLYLTRNTTNEGTKAQLRAVSTKVLERAERIKQAKKDHIRPVEQSRLAPG